MSVEPGAAWCPREGHCLVLYRGNKTLRQIREPRVRTLANTTMNMVFIKRQRINLTTHIQAVLKYCYFESV